MSFNQAARATRARFYQRHAPGVTIAQHVVHLDAIVDHLRQSLGQDKIIVMGHSWERRLACYTRRPIQTRYLLSSASTQWFPRARDSRRNTISFWRRPHAARITGHWLTCGKSALHLTRSWAKCWQWKSWSSAMAAFFTRNHGGLGLWFELSLATSSRRGKSRASFTPTTYRLRR